MNPGFPQFDPSKMDPKVLMELSLLIQQLPPEQLSRMQTLMHNAMAGYDVRAQMEEFEKSLPPGFRDKIMSLMAGQAGSFVPKPDIEISAESSIQSDQPAGEIDLHEARLTVLRGVAAGHVTPEDAERLLFNAG